MSKTRRMFARHLCLPLLLMLSVACSGNSSKIADAGTDARIGDATDLDASQVHDGAPTDGPAFSDGAASDASPRPDTRPAWYALGNSELHSWAVSPGDSASGGGLSASSISSTSPELVLDGNALPIVAWREGRALYVQRFDGTNWVGLGASATGTGVAEIDGAPRIIVDGAGRPVVAWRAYSSHEPHVARFDGTSWVGLDGGAVTSVSTDRADQIALAGAGAADVALAWSTASSGQARIYVHQFRAGAWHDLDSSTGNSGVGDPTASAQYPALALDAAGLPVVAWLHAHGSIYVKRWTGSLWQEIDGSASGDGLSKSARSFAMPSLAVDGAGGIAVAWLEGVDFSFSTLDHVYLKYWGGSGWQPLGPSASGIGMSVNQVEDSRSVALSTDAAGELWLSWNEATNGVDEVRVRHWATGSWQSLPGPREVSDPILAVSGAASPVLAWVNGRDVYVARHESGTWIGFGTSVPDGGLKTTEGTVDVLRLAAHGDELVVGWRERTPTNVARGHATRWQAGGWIDLGACCSSDIYSPPRRFDMSLTADGKPVALWSHRARLGYSDARTVYYLRIYDGAWTSLGNDLVPSSLADGESFALLADGSPLLSYAVSLGSGNFGFRIRNWQNDSWEDYSSFDHNTSVGEIVTARDDQDRVLIAWRGYSRTPVSVWRSTADGWEDLGDVGEDVVSYALVLDTTGEPMLAWQSRAGAVRFAQREAGGWVGLDGSELEAGISASDAIAGAPSLALDPQGRPVVAYRDESTGRKQIYLQRFNGSGWQEHAGSASAGGVSNSRAASDLPAVAVTTKAVCVSWTEPGITDSVVLLRCSDL